MSQYGKGKESYNDKKCLNRLMREIIVKGRV